MDRIDGVNLPANKRVEVALTYVYGIGKSSAKKIVEEAGIDSKRRLNDLTDSELTNIEFKAQFKCSDKGNILCFIIGRRTDIF